MKTSELRQVIAKGMLLSLCGLFASACTSGNLNQPVDVSYTDASATNDTATIDVAALESLATMDTQGVDIRGGFVGSEFVFVIDPGFENAQFDVNEINNPSRIVMDIEGAQTKSLDSIPLTAPQGFERIRLGEQDSGARLVFDLTGSESADIQTRYDSKGRIILSAGDTLGQMADAATSPELALPEPAIKEMATEKAMLSPALEAIRFGDQSRGEGALIAEMTSAGIFEIQRTAPSEYTIRLEKASILPTVEKTLLNGANATGIKAVRVSKDGSDAILKIFTTPDFDLSAITKNGDIHVIAQGATPMGDSSDMRAQLADGEEEVEAEADDFEEDDESSIASLLDEPQKYTGRLISLDLQDTDIDNALRIIAEVSNLNIIASDDVAGKVTLRLIDVPWDQALDVILKTNGLDKVREGNVVRIAPVEKLRQEREQLKDAQRAEDELAPLRTQYFRISYARAADMRPLVETVLSERGSASVDERTNQLIVRDITRGIEDSVVLVQKLDLRTPQVLLETQIVEADRSFGRELGSTLTYNNIQSPETGNATGNTFPNAITTEFGSSFATTPSSFINLVLDSADGTRQLTTALSAAENEGTARVISRPAVVTTNNTSATIKSVEKIRVKTPSGGVSVATGSGAQSAGSGGVATETFEIGITLDVTPQASPDYFVLLDINAKSSTLGSEVVDGIPSEIERSATSTVLVSSGQTFAIGGIYTVSDSTSNEGVPYLKDIPILGQLFRRTITDNSDEELIFFITPRIVEGSFDDAAMQIGS